MDTLRIRNWEKWQSYRSDRGQPPWIKIYRALMRDPNWVALSDAQRGQLVVIWLLAADRNGVIPASPALLQKLCFMDSEPDLQVFVEHGFIEHDANVTPIRRQVDLPEKRRVEKSREEKKRKHALPSDWKPNGTHATLAKSEGVDIVGATSAFRDYELANGRLMLDWDACFRTWLNRQKEFARSTPQGQVDEGERDSQRKSEAAIRETTRNLDRADEEALEAEQQEADFRQFYDSLSENEQRGIEAETKRRARMIQPSGKLLQLALKGCFAQVVTERMKHNA